MGRVGIRFRVVSARRRSPIRRHDERCGPNVLEEVDSLDQVHREKPAVVLAHELPQRDEVRMLHLLHHAELALEAKQVLGVRVAQGFHGEARAATLAIDRLVHDAHAALTDPSDDLEAFRLEGGLPHVSQNTRVGGRLSDERPRWADERAFLRSALLLPWTCLP